MRTSLACSSTFPPVNLLTGSAVSPSARVPRAKPLSDGAAVQAEAASGPRWRAIALCAVAAVQRALQTDLPERGNGEDPVKWVLRIRGAHGSVVAPLAEWGRAGHLEYQYLLAAVDGGALRPVAGYPRQASLHDLLSSEQLLTVLSCEHLHASGLQYPPTWRRTLGVSVERPAKKARGRLATRTRPVTVASHGEQAE